MLAGKKGLLDALFLLDNCEHLIEPVTRLVEQLVVEGRRRLPATYEE